MKYLELFKNGFDSTIDEKVQPENGPYVGYSPTEGLAFTIVPEPYFGPADNEIWYTTSDGEIITPKLSGTGYNIISNNYEDGKGVVTFDNIVTSIGESAFEECFSLTSVTLPDSVTSIGVDAFSNCPSLTSVNIPNSVTSIKSYAFYYCPGLTSIVIPNSVTSIGQGAFSRCSLLTSVIIPNSVTSIGNHAFSGCDSLTTITIGNSVTNIESDAFIQCYKLTKTNYTGDIEGWCNIMFGNSNANPIYLSHSFYINDQEIKDLVIPNTVTSIRDDAFYGFNGLISITIPNSVTSIGKNALRGCSSLISVTIPNSVKSIGNWAFVSCSSLTSITFEGTMNQWNNINKGVVWNSGVPATYVQCSDGQAPL